MARSFINVIIIARMCMFIFQMFKCEMIMQNLSTRKKYTTKWMNEEEKICVWLIKHAYYPYSACITISLSFSCMTKISKKMTAKEKKTKKIKYCNSTKAIFRFSAHYNGFESLCDNMQRLKFWVLASVTCHPNPTKLHALI